LPRFAGAGSFSGVRSAITIGNFDGVHRGHRALVESIVGWKRGQAEPDSVRTVVMTFEPHPVEVLRPGTLVPRLTPVAEKQRLLYGLGVDEVRVVPFTAAFSKTSARDFFDHVLLQNLKGGFIAVGGNFFFGHNREGSPGRIVDWAQERGFEAKIIPGVESDGDLISSSRIRRLIEAGEMVPAARLLGRDYSITGDVVHGDKRGRQLGFPTANLVPAVAQIGAPCLPARRVYLSSATIEGKTYPSITNVGVKPTVSNSGQVTVETHLLLTPTPPDLYGKQLTVEFRDRLRAEMKFQGLAELVSQIQQDIETARARLGLR